MTWYSYFGFDRNPFETKPVQNIAGYDRYRKMLAEYLKSGSVVLLTGEYGIGKTSLILSVLSELSKSYKTIYIHAPSEIGRIFKIKPGFFEWFSQKKKIIALDDVKELKREVIDYIKHKYDIGEFYSIVFSGTNPDLPEDVMHRIGNRIINIEKMEYEEAILMLNSRLKDFNKYLDKEALKRVYEFSKGNPRTILSLLESLFILAYENGKNYVNLNLVEEYISNLQKKAKKEKKISIKKEREPIVRLSPQQRQIVEMLSTVDFASLSEIHEKTGISKGSLAKQLSRLLKKGVIEKIIVDGKIKYKLIR